MTLFLFLTTDAVQWYLLLVPSLQHFRVHCEPVLASFAVCCQQSHLQHQPRSFRLTQESRGPVSRREAPAKAGVPESLFPRVWPGHFL